MFFLIALGFWLVLVLLSICFFMAASRLERMLGHSADELLTLEDRFAAPAHDMETRRWA